ncbi:hypothetical protein JTB14_029719 [Gonioctena quinquepunctata]|nr:hypothetical protein JTB14_029719 [Gonioctena quinquepunctata]
MIGEGCVEKPLATLWKNYTQSSRPDVRMQLTVCGGGLRATTKDHGLTEYWAHRLTTCASSPQFPRLFFWVYMHGGRRLRHELRCHAVLCSTTAVANKIEEELKHSLALALLEFKRDKLSRQNARLSLVNSVYDNPTIPRRKILLSTGSHNYKPPLERSKSAPKLTSIEEIIEEEDDVFQSSKKLYKDILKHCDSTSSLLDRRKSHLNRFHNYTVVPAHQNKGPPKTKVSFNNLEQSVLSNDLLESCERAWFNALNQKPDLIPPDSDEGSLSSGCESAGTATSEMDEPVFSTMNNNEVQEKESEFQKKTDLDFRVGGTVLSVVRSFEKTANPDILKFCGMNNVKKRLLLEHGEVSLIPVGENQTDFSSLKVFKRRSISDPSYARSDACGYEEDENVSACSDESGYEEDELASSVGNIVLV